MLEAFSSNLACITRATKGGGGGIQNAIFAKRLLRGDLCVSTFLKERKKLNPFKKLAVFSSKSSKFFPQNMGPVGDTYHSNVMILAYMVGGCKC